MRTIEFSNNFKKSMKTVRSYDNYKQKELDDALNKLANGEPLPERMRDHAMVKQSRPELQGTRVFHLRPDLAVVYKISDNKLEVLNIGKHNQLRLTSSYDIHKKS